MTRIGEGATENDRSQEGVGRIQIVGGAQRIGGTSQRAAIYKSPSFSSSFPNSVWERTCTRNSVSQAGQQSCQENVIPKQSLGTRIKDSGKRREAPGLTPSLILSV